MHTKSPIFAIFRRSAEHSSFQRFSSTQCPPFFRLFTASDPVTGFLNGLHPKSNFPEARITSTQPSFLWMAICCGLLLALRPASAETKPDDSAPTLKTIEDFHSAAQTSACKPIADADANYRSKLEEFQKIAQDTGNLKSVLAAKDAIKELNAGRPPLASDNTQVAAIQQTYIAQRQKANLESKKALAKANQDYLASLKELVVDLTKAGNIDQAVAIQAKVDGLAASPTLSPATKIPNPAVDEIEVWKKKALVEFPALKQTDSELTKSVKALRENKEATSPDFFKNPQWPYLLAQEANKKIHISSSGNSKLTEQWEHKSLRLKAVISCKLPKDSCKISYNDNIFTITIDFSNLSGAQIKAGSLSVSVIGLLDDIHVRDEYKSPASFKEDWMQDREKEMVGMPEGQLEEYKNKFAKYRFDPIKVDRFEGFIWGGVDQSRRSIFLTTGKNFLDGNLTGFDGDQMTLELVLNILSSIKVSKS